MAYTRLNLQDYKDKWTAASVKHLEDGIVENNESIATLQSQGDASVLAAVLSSTTVMPLWMTLLSDGGKKIYPPTLSFNGDVTNKILVPYADVSSNPYEHGAFFVRAGDPLLITNFTTGFVATFAGLPHVVLPIIVNQSYLNGSPMQESSSPEGIASESMLAFAAQMATPAEEGFVDGVIPFYSMMANSSISSDISVISQAALEFFSAAFTNPIGFIAPNDFAVGDKIYPSGTYVLYTQTKALKYGNYAAVNYPWFYIDNIWNLSVLESSVTHNTISIDTLNCNETNSVFTAYQNILYWDGMTHLPYSDAEDEVLLSRNPWSLAKLWSAAETVSVQKASGELVEVYLDTPTSSSDSWDFVDVVDADGNWYATVVLHPFYENSILYQPGIYSYSDENSPMKIVYEGVNVNDYIDKKIPYKHIPDVPTFDLTVMGMPMIMPGEEAVSCTVDATELCLAVDKGPIKIIGMTPFGEVTAMGTATKWNDAYQLLIQAKLNGQRLELEIEFNNSSIDAKIEVL